MTYETYLLLDNCFYANNYDNNNNNNNDNNKNNNYK